MYVDRAFAAAHRDRSARDHGVDILLDAWSGSPKDRRAAMVAAQGDLARAASYAGGAWQKLLDGDVKAVLDTARKAAGSPGMGYIEAEALFSVGAVVTGLERLEDLHRQGEPAATLALARRRHQLGDHPGAVRVAKTMPWHAHAALTGARSALMANRPGIALQLVEPYLEGCASVPEPAVAGAFATTTAAILARFGEHSQLRRFVDRLLPAGDLAEDMMPAVARAAWIGGRAREAWHRFDVAHSPWCLAARLELAILAGDAGLAAQLLSRADPLGVGSRLAVRLLQGQPDTRVDDDGDRRLTDSARQVFAAGRTVHVWRTHPHRWQSWIEAALLTPAHVVVCDLAAKQLPDSAAVPWAVLDDGALIEELAPIAVQGARLRGVGVHVGGDLCRGVGIGHEWPSREDEFMRGSLPLADGKAAVEVLNAEQALTKVGHGRPLVVIAPPGDPFWAGPIPERLWQSVRVVRADAHRGWAGAGRRVVEAAQELQGSRPAAEQTRSGVAVAV